MSICSLIVTSALGQDPLSPTLFVFFNRRRTLLNALYWDRTGFCLVAKRLELPLVRPVEAEVAEHERHEQHPGYFRPDDPRHRF